MDIIHPNYLGTVVIETIRDESFPYAIFVGDNHASHTTQQNIARLYEHYATNNNLTLVGCEGGEDYHISTDKSLLKRLGAKPDKVNKKLRKQIMNEVVKPEWNKDYTRNNYPTHIIAVARLLGYELEMFNLDPYDRFQKLPRAIKEIKEIMGKVSDKELLTKLEETFESLFMTPEFSYGMLERFTKKLFSSGKRIAMFISGMEHIDKHIIERLPELQLNYVVIYPHGIKDVDLWLSRKYAKHHADIIKGIQF